MDANGGRLGRHGAPGPVPGGRAALRRAAGIGLLALAALAGCAAPEATLRQMEEARPLISRGIADVVDAADRAFGESRLEDRERIVSARIGGALTFRENHWPSPGLPLSLRIPLPALERRANVFLQFDTTAESFHSLGDTASSLSQNKSLGLAFLTRVADLVDTGARLDLFWSGGPHAGVRPFVRYEWRADPHRGLFEQQVYLNTDVGPGEKSIVQVDRIIDDVSFVRFRASVRTEGDVAGNSQEYALIYRRPIERWDAAFSAETGVAFNPYDGDPVAKKPGRAEDPDEGFARLRLTGRVLRPWIEYEVAPGLFHPWRHEDPWEFGITFTVRLLYEDYLRNGVAPPAPAPAPQEREGGNPSPPPGSPP